ncbi:RHS repeat-associated core domain-containing protein [Bizionia sp.]|uniref:RHS repeat-associated core domain-containing protein n=1 Tax=Bizionia sp. TaxID=1954480 RepID=UPI003A947BDF
MNKSLKRINGVWEDNADRDRFVLEDGHFEVDLNLPGDRFRIYFEKGTSSDDGMPTTCHIDNLIITQNIIEIVQAKNYYPFGMDHQYGASSAMSITNGHKFKYNVQEHDESFGLNATEMTFRQFDMALGRFHGIDKLAAHNYNITPYHFGANNPIYYSDPSGLLETASISSLPYWAQNLWHQSNAGYMTNWTNDGNMWSSEGAYNYSIESSFDGISFIQGDFVGGGGGMVGLNGGFIGEVNGLQEVVITGSGVGGKGNDWGTFVADGNSLNNGINQIYSQLEFRQGYTFTLSNQNITNINTLSKSGSLASALWGLLDVNMGKTYLTTKGIRKDIFVKNSKGIVTGVRSARAGMFATQLGLVRAGSYGLAGFGLSIDAIGVYNYYYSSDPNAFTVTPGRAGLNLTFTLIGLWGGPVGWVASVTYFGLAALHDEGYIGNNDPIKWALSYGERE